MNQTGAPAVRIGDWISEGWRMFADQWKGWVVNTLVFFLLVVAPISLFGFFIFFASALDASGTGLGGLIALLAMLLVIPLMFVLQTLIMGGMYRAALKQLRGGRVEVSDLFSARDKLGSIVGATLLVSIVVAIGIILCVIPAFIALGLFFFTLPLILDRNLGVIDAMKASKEITSQNLWMFTLFAFVTYLLAQIGAYACYIGLLATYPLLFTITAVAYRDTFGLAGAQSFLPPSPTSPPHYGEPPSAVYTPPPPVQEATPVCFNCQASVPATAAFCPRCGTPRR